MENRLLAPNSLSEFESFHINNQNQTLDFYNSPSPMQRTSNLGAKSTDFQDQFVTGIPFSGPSALTSIVTSRNSLQNVPNFATPEPPIYPLEGLRTYVPNDFTNCSSSSFTSPVNYASETNRFRGEFLPFSWISTNNVNLNTDNPYGSCNFSNELSLSLATSQPSYINGTNNIPDQCSEISTSSKELSLSCSSYRNRKLSHVLSGGSRYLQVVQEILTQIASYSMEILEQMCFSSGGIKAGAASSISFSSMYGEESEHGEFHVDPGLQRRALEAKKAQLLTLLQVVDDQYSQCLDQIHTVVSAFHAATELDPQMHTRFVLQTISVLYKSLRERISNQILAMGARVENRDSEEGSQESCYFQKQWTLQQLKKRDHQLWKPQRGLPERSVSVLRSWMFQNFLHPYPKDAEKHLLAVKSGLTRSQVSNWFINARVRLWKPMIEEMYAEMNKRKAREEGSSNNHRNHMSYTNLRFIN